MDWLQAQSAARGGKIVRRSSWEESTKAVIMSAGTLNVLDSRGFGSQYIPSAEDSEATDWGTVEQADLETAQASAAKARDEAQHALATGEAPPTDETPPEAPTEETDDTHREEGGGFFGGKKKKK